MSAQYGRQVKLTIANAAGAALDLTQFRCRFHVKQMDLETPNSLLARVYNLKSGTVQDILAAFGREQAGQVILQAGYGDTSNFGTIFLGDIVYFRSGKENPTDSYLDILAADADLAYNFATVNTTLDPAAATPAGQLGVVKQALQAQGVTFSDDLIEVLPTTALPRGKVLFGMARDYVRTLAITNQMQWSIVNGQFQLTKETGFIKDQAIVLNSTTGMVGIPEQQPDGVHIRALINPAFKPGRLLQLDNKDVQQYLISPAFNATAQLYIPAPAVTADGVYEVIVADHEGDTRGNQFYTEIICISPKQAIPPGLLTRLVGVPQQ